MGPKKRLQVFQGDGRFDDDDGASIDLEREADIDRCGALKEFWYVACLSKQLGSDKPLARTVFGIPLALFRDAQGVARAVRDRCLHRATALSDGVVVDGALCCPYHGWSYDGGGRCVHIPSLGPTQRGATLSEVQHGEAGLHLTPADVGCLPAYATREQDGLVYVYVGDAGTTPRKDPFRVPYAGHPDWTVYFMVTTFRNGVTNLVENFMDVPHTVFAHRGWFRSPQQKRVPATVERAGGSVLVAYDQKRDRISTASRIFNPRGTHDMVHTDHYFIPNITRVDYLWGDRAGFIINSQCTPVSARESIVYTAISYRLPLDLPRAVVGKVLEPFIHAYTRRVIEQDVDIMDAQQRGMRGPEPVRFASSEADLLHADIEAYRRWLLDGGNGEGPADARRSIEFWI